MNNKYHILFAFVCGIQVCGSVFLHGQPRTGSTNFFVEMLAFAIVSISAYLAGMESKG